MSAIDTLKNQLAWCDPTGRSMGHIVVTRDEAIELVAASVLKEGEELVVASMLDGMKCRFGCKAPVVGIYWMERGCACHADQVQALCGQHAVSAEPLGEMRLICGPGPY